MTTTTTMATARRATGYDDNGKVDDEFDGDGAMGDGVTGDYGNDDDYGDGQ